MHTNTIRHWSCKALVAGKNGHFNILGIVTAEPAAVDTSPTENKSSTTAEPKTGFKIILLFKILFFDTYILSLNTMVSSQYR